MSLEATPQDFAKNLVTMFRPLHKALVGHGSLWLILGDGWAQQGQDVPNVVLKAMVDEGWIHQDTYFWNKGQKSDYVFHLTKGEVFWKEPMYVMPKEIIKSPAEELQGAGFMAFPVGLASKLIKATCPQDGTVLDPFAGTGATIEAALVSGRRSIGIDISQSELNVAQERLKAVEAVGNSLKLKKAVDAPEKFDLKIVSKGFSGGFNKKDSRFIVAGYASPVMVDLEGHKITHEALARDLPRFMAGGGQYANVNILHSNITIGKILPEYEVDGKMLKTTVDDRGLFVVAEIRTDEAAPVVCKQVIQDIKNGKLRSFSISGNADNPVFQCDGDRCFYAISDLQLSEITICEEGVNPGAKFNIINKSKGGTEAVLTYKGLKLIKKIEKGQNEADIGQGEALQVDSEEEVNEPTKIPFNIAAQTSERDLTVMFAQFSNLFKATYSLNGLDIVLFDPKTGEVLLPEE